MVGPYRQGVAKLAPKPTERSPERQALAYAIAKATEYARGLDACRAGVKAAEEMEAAALLTLAEARAGVEQAKAERAAEITAAAFAGQAVPANDRQRLARQCEAEAQDELDAVRASLAVVRAPLADWEYWARHSSEKVREAAGAVLMTQLPSAVAVALTAIKNAEVCVRSAFAIHRLAPTAASTEILRPIAATPRAWEVRDLSRGDGPDWTRALSALLSDADAPLPALREMADILPGEPGPASLM